MSDTKARILSAAEELITKNGIENTTITKIARKAGVADSLAYQYFKGKEDLVFSALNERMKEATELLHEQLQGLSDAKSRLSKMIWYGLRYNDQHPGYVRNLVFECRSNPKFYESRGYHLITNHARIMLDILNQGVSEGVFRKDLDTRLVRDVIYGTIDFESISCVATREIEESSHDLDKIMALILPVIEAKEVSGVPDKRKNILLSAEKIFAEKGYAGAKIHDIAELAHVASGSIYDYFKNKEDLLLSISEARLASHVNHLSKAFNIKTPVQKLRRFLRLHFTLFMKNQNFLKVFLQDTLLRSPFYLSKAYGVHRKYCKIVEDIITEGKREGDFREDVDERVFRNMFLGTFTHVALRWIIFPDGNFDKIAEINQVIEFLSTAVQAKTDG